MKYEFIDKDLDTYILKYGDKEFEFKSSIGITSKVQSYIKQGRLKMLRDLAKDGMTIDDLIIEKKKDGKTYRDETNKIAYEKMYTDEAMLDVLNDVCLETFKMDLTELILDIGLITDDEGLEFGTLLMEKLLGKKSTPSTNERSEEKDK